MRIIHRNKNCTSLYSITYMWKDSITCSSVKENKFFPSSFIFKFSTEWIWPQRDEFQVFYHLIMSIFLKQKNIWSLSEVPLINEKKKKEQFRYCFTPFVSHPYLVMLLQCKFHWDTLKIFYTDVLISESILLTSYSLHFPLDCINFQSTIWFSCWKSLRWIVSSYFTMWYCIKAFTT